MMLRTEVDRLDRALIGSSFLRGPSRCDDGRRCKNGGRAWGGVRANTMALSHRHPRYAVNPRALFRDRARVPEISAKVIDFREAFVRHSIGTMALTYRLYGGSVEHAFTPGEWERLVALKRRCHPTLVLRFNPIIQPARSRTTR